MSITAEKKAELIKDNATGKADTGSPEVRCIKKLSFEGFLNFESYKSSVLLFLRCRKTPT